MIRTILGEVCGISYFCDTADYHCETTRTSLKFANMTQQALAEFENGYSVKLEKITKIPLEGDGTIERRVERYTRLLVDCAFNTELRPSGLYVNIKVNAEWISVLHEADTRSSSPRTRKVPS